MSPEEKREARAHRNRIAAQNSRDKRKVQFQHLELRVAELEAENQQLRSSLSSAQPGVVLAPTFSERERERDQENQELRERIKVLEQGWASVVQALTAAGQSIPALGLPPSLTQETKPTIPRQDKDSNSRTEIFRPQSPAASVTSTPSLTFSSMSASTDDSARHPAAGEVFIDAEAFTSLQSQNPTLPITTQADPQIDAWLQDILQPGAQSPISSPAFTFSSSPSLDLQDSIEEQGIGELEFNTMDMSWALSGDVADQFLNLIDTPLPALGTEAGETMWTVEPVSII